jgi:hypothetical protein
MDDVALPGWAEGYFRQNTCHTRYKWFGIRVEENGSESERAAMPAAPRAPGAAKG